MQPAVEAALEVGEAGRAAVRSLDLGGGDLQLPPAVVAEPHGATVTPSGAALLGEKRQRRGARRAPRRRSRCRGACQCARSARDEGEIAPPKSAAPGEEAEGGRAHLAGHHAGRRSCSRASATRPPRARAAPRAPAAAGKRGTSAIGSTIRAPPTRRGARAAAPGRGAAGAAEQRRRDGGRDRVDRDQEARGRGETVARRRRARARCRGRIGVNERPMKFTRKRTRAAAGTPGSRITSRKPARGAPPRRAARGAPPRRSTSTQARARPRRAPAVTTKVAPDADVSARKPPASGPDRRRQDLRGLDQADRACRSPRGARARSPWPGRAGPMPPKSPTPIRSASSCSTFVTAALSDEQDHVGDERLAPRSPSGRSGRRGAPRRAPAGRRGAGRCR